MDKCLSTTTWVEDILFRQRAFFHTGQTKEINFRIEQLKKLKIVIKHNEARIVEALKADFNKSELDTYSTEIGFIYEEINHMLKYLKSWAKPARVKTPMTHFGSRSYIYSEPFGLILIISPWNYPFQLVMAPLIGAIAAGNCALIKPSELTPVISQVVQDLIEEAFPQDYIAVIQAGVEESQALLQQKFDYIFFTGSIGVGKIVMESATKTLTPVTLELGGKSPCIVHKDAKLELAAKRIVWGKFLNAGQTCIAPDYLVVHKDIRNVLLEKMKEAIQEFYGTTALENEDYTGIINDSHFERLVSYLKDGRILVGGNYDVERRVIEPTIIDQVTWEQPIMHDEIFGPILPMLDYENVTEVIEMINERPKPLALYFFSEDPELQDQVIHSISYGGGCINDTLMHFASPYLPFGGVGTSGIGSYHGKMSFDLFSHKKSVLRQTSLFDITFRYPSNKYALKAMKRLMK